MMVNNNLVGGAITFLKHMSSSMGRIIPCYVSLPEDIWLVVEPPTPLKYDGVLVSWDYSSQLNGKKMFQTTNQPFMIFSVTSSPSIGRMPSHV
jgi:hypothetical protein